MKVIFSAFDRGDHTSRYRPYWPTNRYRNESKVQLLKDKIISIPKTKEEAQHNKYINSEIIALKSL